MNVDEYKYTPTSQDIQLLQDVLLQGPMVEVHTDHYFADGMYCRSLYLKQGNVIVGRVHKKEHFFIISSGTITILGDGYKETIVGPRILVSKPGTKRAGYAHTDVNCITVHRTEFTDLEDVEADIAEDAPDSPYTTGNILKPGVLAYEEVK